MQECFNSKYLNNDPSRQPSRNQLTRFETQCWFVSLKFLVDATREHTFFLLFFLINNTSLLSLSKNQHIFSHTLSFPQLFHHFLPSFSQKKWELWRIFWAFLFSLCCSWQSLIWLMLRIFLFLQHLLPPVMVSSKLPFFFFTFSLFHFSLICIYETEGVCIGYWYSYDHVEHV